MPVFLDERTSLETRLPPSPANERNMKQSFGQDEVPKQRVWEPERNFEGNKSSARAGWTLASQRAIN
jgi:hypothetical protein